jgi:hypothetical protein
MIFNKIKLKMHPAKSYQIQIPRIKFHDASIDNPSLDSSASKTFIMPRENTNRYKRAQPIEEKIIFD